MVAVMASWSNAKDLPGLPPTISINHPDDCIIILARPKNSYAPPNQSLIWIKRSNGWHYQHYIDVQLSAEEKSRSLETQIIQFITDKLNHGIVLSKTRIEDGYLEELGMTRNEFRKALARLEATHQLVHRKLPTDKVQGSFKKYLTPPECELPSAV